MLETLEKIEIPKITDRTGGRTGYGWKVVLWNCNCHSFDDVIRALMVAIRCSPQRGFEFAYSIHNSGKAIVYEGHKERCEAVSEILTSKGLRVTMEQ
jgi:ATP-dependent Clp protease adapter protein ClpS